MARDSLIKIKQTFLLTGINRVGKTLKSLGLDLFALNADEIISKSKKNAGYQGNLSKQI